MRYSIAKHSIEARDPNVPWADNAPGLHADETVLKLDTGELVAVSVEPHWEEGNTGLALHGWARLIEEDGSSKVDPAGKVDGGGRPIVIETSLSVNVSPTNVKRHGVQKLTREILLALLGEPPTMVEIEEGDREAAPAGRITWTDADGNTHWQDPDATELPMIPMPDDARLPGSIRYAIANLKTVERGLDAAKALGL